MGGVMIDTTQQALLEKLASNLQVLGDKVKKTKEPMDKVAEFKRKAHFLEKGKAGDIAAVGNNARLIDDLHGAVLEAKEQVANGLTETKGSSMALGS